MELNAIHTTDGAVIIIDIFVGQPKSFTDYSLLYFKLSDMSLAYSFDIAEFTITE